MKHHLAIYLALRNTNSFKLLSHTSAVSPGLRASRLRLLARNNNNGNDMAATTRPGEVPYIYANQSFNIDKELLEGPFIFRSERKRKRWKKKQKNVKVKENPNEFVEDLVKREGDCRTVAQAISLFNSISQDERKPEKETSLRTRNRPTHLLIDELRGRNPHILGLQSEELLGRFKFLSSLGLSQNEALKIAVSFPSFLTLQNANVGNLIKIFLNYKVDLAKLVSSFPFIFSLPYNEVAKKLDHLGSLGLKKKDVSALVNDNPNIICFELNESSKAALKFSTGFSGWKSMTSKSNFIEGLLRTAAQEQCTKYEFDDNFTSVASFLTEINVAVNDIFRKCPTFFSADKEKILDIVHYLGGSPFFFDADEIGEFIKKFPDIFLQLSERKVKEQIDYVWKELSEDAELYELLQNSPKMLTESECLKDRVELFKEWSFKSIHIGYLMKKFPILFIENRVVENLEERLDFLLGNNDLSVHDVMKFPFCLQMRIVLIRCKIGFIRMKNPEILKTTGLQEIFTSKLDKFVEKICTSSLSEFHDYMKINFSNADQDWIKRKGKPRDIKALSESF